MPAEFGVLFLGDIVGRQGRRAMDKFLPGLVKKYRPSLVIANGENAAGGSGITEEIGKDLFMHIDILTSGNHIWDKKEALPFLEREARLIRPANYPPVNPGRSSYVFQAADGVKAAILNLQGRVFMEPLDCPFKRADEEVAALRAVTPIIIVDFHAEATSEKQALGWHLDGRVSAVIGTHTHVPTSDERILPEGTAYITDAGMAGGRNAVIGIAREQALQRFLTSRPQRFEPSRDGLFLSCVFIDIDPATGRALSIKREALEVAFPRVWVEGEVSNYTRAASGHVYFSLKDDKSVLKAVLWKGDALRVAFEMKPGLQVVCRGRVSVYAARGDYQLVVDQVEPKGKGALQLRFEQLKEKLRAEGLFEAARKKALPLRPRTIGIVTSPTGAAIRDILRVLERRYAKLHIIIYAARVQGEGAAAEIVEGIDVLGRRPGIDVLIVGRGGGSIEDLWAFNEEPVARAIARSPVPVISAVGHEVDFTIADFVADVRASTPSAAAEMVIEKEEAFAERIDSQTRRLGELLRYDIQDRRSQVADLAQHRIFQNFEVRLANLGRRVDELETRGRMVLRAERQRIAEQKGAALVASERLCGLVRRLVGDHKAAWARLSAGLNALSPLAVLKKGYAIVWTEGGLRLARRIEDVAAGDAVVVSFFKGEFSARVEGVDRTKLLESRFLKEGE